MTGLINQIRFYHFISGVLTHQQTDLLCSKCRAFSNTAERMKEGISELERVGAEKMHALPPDLLAMLEEARVKIESIKLLKDAVGQKKAGNCRMPEGVCFIKLPKSIMDKI
jgi:hypothetical protein